MIELPRDLKDPLLPPPGRIQRSPWHADHDVASFYRVQHASSLSSTYFNYVPSELDILRVAITERGTCLPSSLYPKNRRPGHDSFGTGYWHRILAHSATLASGV